MLHDCRHDCEALFYLHDVRCAALWDTQVAHGLLDFVSSCCPGATLPPAASGDDHVAPANAPAGLNRMLQRCGLSTNPHKAAVHARMNKEGDDLWKRRPLDPQLLQYAGERGSHPMRCCAVDFLHSFKTLSSFGCLPPSPLAAVADVWQLLPAKAQLTADLGPVAARQVPALSRAYAEWKLDPADRACGVGGNSYASAARLPLGQDLHMSFEGPNYKLRCELVGEGLQGC